VVVVTGDVTGIAVMYLARCAAKGVPDGRRAPVLACRTFDLVRSRRHAKKKAVRKLHLLLTLVL